MSYIDITSLGPTSATPYDKVKPEITALDFNEELKTFLVGTKTAEVIEFSKKVE